MSAAEKVINKFNGVRKLAREIGLSPGTVSRWTKPRSEGGSGGDIPTMNHRKILEAAERLGIEIEPSELVNV